MAIRYSGNVEIRIRLVRMRGWNGKVGPFYKAHLRLPGYAGEGILSPREAGVSGDLRSSEAYDTVARAMLDLALEELSRRKGRDGELITSNAVREKGLRGVFGRWEVLRVQQAPCPIEADLKRRSKQSGGKMRKGFAMTRRDPLQSRCFACGGRHA